MWYARDSIWWLRVQQHRKHEVARKRRYLEGNVGVLAKHLLSVYVFYHVGVDVHVHSCILAQLKQGSNVVLGQPQVSV